MCVIITKSATARIPVSHLEQGNRRNPHGWGIAVRVNKQIIVERGFSSAELVAAYKKYEDKPMVVHCRIGTSGGNTLSNTHPFEIIDGNMLFHNGIFHDIALTTPNRSDTWHLAEQLRPSFVQNPQLHLDKDFQEQMLRYCTKGYTNKLVFFTTRDTIIINRQAGVEHNGCWYSNTSAFPPRTPDLAKWAKWGGQTPSLPVVTKRPSKSSKKQRRHELTASQPTQAQRLRNEAPADLDQLLTNLPATLVEDDSRKAARAEALAADARFQAYLDQKYGSSNTRRRR